ncbi:amidohydrolase [Glutamicibacter sp.]|uniref:amidohydrolase n=1 Tax=Glutamicibacter sp. TaxID=1931995 RepID=UPI003D6BE666
MQADLLFANGPIYTMDPSCPKASALAVRDGRIIAVDGAAHQLRGPSTEVVDLACKALLPGFHDAHVHPLLGGLQLLQCNLDAVHSLAEYREIISSYDRTHPDLEWIRGGGWYGDVFPGGFPTKELLDQLVPDRPAYMLSHDGHGAWVNSRALELAGITDSTPDPAGGIIQRDPSGRATGMLMERAAELVDKMLPEAGDAEIDQALLAAQDYLLSLGIVAWQDAAVGQALGMPDFFDRYRDLERSGKLAASVTGALWWHADQGLDQIPEMIRRRESTGGRFHASAVKLMLDGVCENLTASMTRPYSGHPGNRGMQLIPAQDLNLITRQLDAAGFDMHIHTVGDQAVHDALEALRLPVRDGWDPRHQLAHIDILDPADLELFSRTGAIANIQALWARQDPVLVETKLPYLDHRHQQSHFAFETLRSAGIPLAMGSDWPVSSPDPMWAIHTAVNRTAPPVDPHATDHRSQTQPLLAHEAISLQHALHAQTAGAAYANRQEHLRGTLRTGLQADFAVLEADPFAVEASELGNIGVHQTWIDGELVHELSKVKG